MRRPLTVFRLVLLLLMAVELLLGLLLLVAIYAAWNEGIAPGVIVTGLSGLVLWVVGNICWELWTDSE